MSSLFYDLGKKAGPKVRKIKWIWRSITATEAEIIKAEHDVGRDLESLIKKQLKLDTDHRSRQMLNKLGSRLADRLANKLRTFSFEVIKGANPNAFALPGGFIFITGSLIQLCDYNDDEIAFILAHEMAHVIRGHAMDRIITNSAIAVGVRSTPIRGLLTGWLGKVGVKFLESSYSQDMELEADKLGVRLAVAAGCEPNASKQLLSRLRDRYQPDERSSLGNYFSSHPDFDIRIKNIDRLLRQTRS